MKNRRVIVERFGGPEVMRVVEDEIPDPGDEQARVKILAADVSFSDVNVRRGRYPGGPQPPFTPGYAMVGVVDQLGPGTAASELAVGQTVAALTFYGSYSQYLNISTRKLVPVPAGLDPAEAVCLALNYVAAYQMLHRVAHAARGESVLIYGAAGGVGTAFLELGQLAGLVMYGAASKPKHNLVTSLGATPIDYQSEDVAARIEAETHGRGVDAMFDPIGFAHLRQSVKAVRKHGTVVSYGFYATSNRGGAIIMDVLEQYLWMALWSLPPNRKHATFYDIRPLEKKRPEWFREDLTALLNLLAAGKLHPVIAARLPLDEVVRAHQQVEHAEVQGKLALIPNP